MAFNERKKPLLYSDLFKCSEKQEDDNIVMSSSSTSRSGSSSSGFSTPLYSDLESDGGDFIAELTREMAERMLQEDEDNTESSHVKIKEQISVDYGVTNNLKNGLKSGTVCIHPPIQGQLCKGRRVKGTESAQQKQLQKTHHYHMQHRGRNGHFGSGMQAVFLGGSGSTSGFPGTGVFLPRVTTDPTQLKKKSGCSIVLMPTRVLEALELHFKQRHNSSVPPPALSGWGSLNHKDESTTSKGHSQLETDNDEMQLPQEWTY